MTQNQIRYAEYLENSRHNRASEQETQRNNRAVLAETNRHNVVAEGETALHNRTTEEAERQKNAINQSHYERQDTELQRHNEEVESETNRHNIMTERAEGAKIKETSRHNIESEALAQSEIGIKQQQADATTRNANTQFLNYSLAADRAVYQNLVDEVRVKDFESQMSARKTNTVINVISTPVNLADDTMSAFRNYTQGVNNALNKINVRQLFGSLGGNK